MTQRFTLKSTDKTEINDVRNPQVYPLEGYAYEIVVNPKCNFWRIGLRLFLDDRGPGYSLNNRYNNNHVRHIEICAGIRSGNEWQNPDQLDLQQYHFPNAPDTLISFGNYAEQSAVKLKVKANSFSKKIELQLDDLNSEWIEVDLGFYRSFQIWGWADFSEFDIDLEVRSSLCELPIELKELKALSFLHIPIQFTLRKLNIFFGPNNCGKTSILLAACQARGSMFYASIDYIGLNRFYSSSEYDIKIVGLEDHERESKQGDNRRKRTEANIGQNEPFDWMVELALQSENTRDKILAWMGEHFEPWELQEVKTGKFITGVKPTVNSVSPVEQGTGARAVLPIIIQLFNPNLDVLAIDEPEFGLEPKMQKLIFNAIKDSTEGRNGFPLKRVLVATHSHLFLDREEARNNFSVQKLDGGLVIKQLNESIELQEATYNLLGCNPSDLFFPSNIVIVEGRSDEIFLKAVYKVGKASGYFNSDNLAFHFLDGYEKLSYAPEAIIQMLKTQAYSPVYKEKICGLFDKPSKQTILIDKIREYFDDKEKERFVLLEKKGIEYYYPLTIINSIFQSDLDPEGFNIEIDEYLNTATIENQFRGKICGSEISKTDFANRVSTLLSVENFREVDNSILKLLKKADELAYK